MITTIQINNFKCFKNNTFHFRNLTVLAGSNSVGKSTLIQAILLSRIAEDKLKQYRIININFERGFKIEVPLNGMYLLSLGNTLEVLTRDTNSNIISINIKDQDIGKDIGKELNLKFLTEDNKKDCYNLTLHINSSLIHALRILKKEFYYLNAERLGPRLTYDVDQLDYIHVGWQGEYTIQILAQNKENPIEDFNNRGFESTVNAKLGNQVRSWMNYIIPNSYIDEADLNGTIKKAFITYSKSSPPNVGFGVSYILPIIVNGLLAKPDSLFIVENPEAHLHPKGQSNIGYFLGQMASSGLQVIVETHSEHVINGIRRFALSRNALRTSDILINFFSGFDDARQPLIEEINIAETGDLTSFPRDFFDQVQQDMAQLFKLRRNK